MKKILFTLLVLAFVGCEGIGYGDLYLVPPEIEKEYIDGFGFWGSGVSHYGIIYKISSNNKEIKQGDFKSPTYVELPVGHYTVYLESVFRTYLDIPIYSDTVEIVIRRNQTTRLDILPF